MQCEDKWMPNRPQRAFLRDDLGVVYNNNNNNNNKQTKTTNRQKQSSEGRQREAGLVLYWAGGADSIGQVGQTVSGRWGRHYWAGGADTIGQVGQTGGTGGTDRSFVTSMSH